MALFANCNETLTVTGRFAPLSVRPLDVSPSRRFTPGRIQRFLVLHFIFYYFKAASDNFY